MANKDDVRVIVNNLLFNYNVKYDVREVGDSSIFTIEKFGTKVVFMDGQEFSDKELEGWNVGYVHPDYEIKKAVEKVFLALMRGGYIHYLRMNYPRTFKSIMTFEGWDKIIRDRRKEIYSKYPKYNYWLELNQLADMVPTTEAIAKDPSIYDILF